MENYTILDYRKKLDEMHNEDFGSEKWNEREKEVKMIWNNLFKQGDRRVLLEAINDIYHIIYSPKGYDNKERLNEIVGMFVKNNMIDILFEHNLGYLIKG